MGFRSIPMERGSVAGDGTQIQRNLPAGPKEGSQVDVIPSLCLAPKSAVEDRNSGQCGGGDWENRLILEKFLTLVGEKT